MDYAFWLLCLFVLSSCFDTCVQCLFILVFFVYVFFLVDGL